MKSSLFAVCLFVVSSSLLRADEAPVLLREPWGAVYAGQDATGEHVVGLWHFDAGAETADASGRAHDAVLDGAAIAAEGRFGAALETRPGYPIEDQPHRAVVKNHPALSPQGAFAIEMWIQPSEQLNPDYPRAFLLDKKYVAGTDYQLILGQDQSGRRTLTASLGFGDRSVDFGSDLLRFEPGQWYHVAFTYDGSGLGRFFINGRPAGSHRESGVTNIASGGHNLVIGDRVGSLYFGFPGRIDEVRITRGPREFRDARIERLGDRSCFVRMEPDVTLRFALTNLRPEPIAKGTLTLELIGAARQATAISDLAPGKTVEIDFPLDTRLRPDAYQVIARGKTSESEADIVQETFDVRIVPRQPPSRFPVIMWGVSSRLGGEFDDLEKIGFTHSLGPSADGLAIWKAGKPTAPGSPEAIQRNKQVLDEALARNITVIASLSPCHGLLESEPGLLRVDREGKPYQRKDACCLFPELQTFSYNVGASMAETYGHMPAFGAAMIDTEVRDRTEVCFHPHDVEAFRKHAGFDIPAEVKGKHGVRWSDLPEFPASRVIPDDHPIYVYYKWFWKDGDGWNAVHSELARGLKTSGRKDFWTYYDPAVRVPSIYGSGGQVDVISQWTYSYPNPIRIGLATDELLAMAGGADHPQDVMKMTQIIWYRSQTAPMPESPEQALPYQAPWELEQPDARFITIPPSHLREAFWTKIARPIRGIMYHGWQSLVPRGTSFAYRYTHPETQRELARLVREVVRPLGPTLLSVPGVKSDVAFLESFASQMFAHRGTYGWCGGWEGDLYHALLYAHLQPEVVYDETIIERGLDGYRVLVMPNCDVITQKMADAITKFQAAGGVVVGDARTAPAIKPDIVLKLYKATGKADEDKAALEKLAVDLRAQLDARYQRDVDTDNPEVIPYRRRFGQTDYVFVVNDHREYGNYVGHHGLVMENGLPSDAKLTVRRAGGVVYDLVTHREVAAVEKDGVLSWDTHLGPCDGTVFMVAPEKIDRVTLETPESAGRGEHVECVVAVLDTQSKPVDAVVPLEITVRDADGREAEFSGNYAAVSGKLTLGLDIATNDAPGVWQIEVRDLAAGKETTGYLRIVGPTPWPPARGPVDPSAADAVQPQG